MSQLLDIHEQIKELRIFFKMAPRTNFLLNAFSFYVTTNKKHADPVKNSQIPDNLSSSQCHFLTKKARITSNVSFERSFTELQNGHRFCYVFLIAWILNTDKHVDDDCLKFEGKKEAREK